MEVNEQEIKQEALSVIERSKIVKITDQASYNQATSLLLEQVMPFRKKWKLYWQVVKKPLKEAVDAVQAKFNEADEPLEKAEKAIKAELSRWETEQERIRQELQRKAEKEAREREENERILQATLAEEEGARPEEVEAIVQAPVTVVAPPVERTYERASGVSSRDNYKCKVNDLKALCKAIGAGKVPVNYVLPNESVLNARARADRETLNIPGCVAWNDKVISGRSR